MVSNQGRITTLAADANIDKGLVDGTDKLHSGILKALETFTLGSMCVSHAGFTIGSAGGYTQYTLAQPIKYTEHGKYATHTTSDLTVAYSSTVQDALYSRYDWVLLDPNSNSGSPAYLEIVQGTAGADPIISDIPINRNKIPIALVHITSGNPSDDDKTDYSFQTYTFDNPANSLSIVSGNTKLGHIERIGITSNIEIASTANNGNIEITPDGTGDLILDGLKWPQADGLADQVLKTDGSGQLSFVAQSGGGSSLDIDGYSALGGTGLHQTQDHFVFSDNGTEKKISFTNLEDAIFGNVSGDIAIAAGGEATIQADSVEGSMINDNAISGQAEMTGDVEDTDELLVSDAGTLKRADFSVVRDAVFNDVSGDVTIAAGGAATIQANSVALGTDTTGNYMTDVSAGTGIDITHTPAEGSTATIAVDVSDFMTNGSNNRIVTATGADGMNAEGNATFDGATLAVTDSITATFSVTAPEVTSNNTLKALGTEMVGAEVLDDSGQTTISGFKSIVYVNELTLSTSGGSPVPNFLELPRASTVALTRLTIKNINSGTAASQNAITIEPNVFAGDTIDFGQTDHSYVTAPNVINLTVGQSVTLHAITDSSGAIQTGWYIIGM